MKLFLHHLLQVLCIASWEWGWELICLSYPFPHFTEERWVRFMRGFLKSTPFTYNVRLLILLINVDYDHIWNTACCRGISAFWLLEIGGSIMLILYGDLVVQCRTMGINYRWYHWQSNAHFFLTVRPKLRSIHIMLAPISKSQKALNCLQHALLHFKEQI